MSTPTQLAAAADPTDGQGMGILNESECRALIASVRLGRIALTDRALPIILPVGFAQLGDDLIFRVGHGALSRAAHMEQVVCFETDWIDDAFDAAWSVTAIGQLTVVDDPCQLRQAAQLNMVSWSETAATFVMLHPEMISGRQRSQRRVRTDACVSRPDELHTQPPRSGDSSPSSTAGC